MKKSNVAELAKALNAAGIPPLLKPHESQFLIQVSQLVAEGQPVSFEQIQEIAKNIQMTSEEATTFAKQMGEVNREGNIVGWMGLSQQDHPHKFQINTHKMATWCAWDTLFLPLILRRTARVESTCPSTKELVHLTIRPDKVESFEPREAVISIVIPKIGKMGPESVEEIWMTFCHQVHFFISPAAASSWLSGKHIEASILSVDEGYQLGKLAFKEILKYVESDS